MELTIEEKQYLSDLNMYHFLKDRYENEARSYPYSSQMVNILTNYINKINKKLKLLNLTIIKIKHNENAILSDKELILQKDEEEFEYYLPNFSGIKMQLEEGKLRSYVEGLL